MGQDKKDLTRIEDLGEFLHELDETEDYLPALPDDALTDELPALPLDDELLATEELPTLPVDDEESFAFSSTSEDSGPFTLSNDENEALSVDLALENEPEVVETSPTFTTEETWASPKSDTGFEAEEGFTMESDHQADEEESTNEPETKWDTEVESETNDAPEPAIETQDLRPEPEEAFTPKEDFDETRNFAEKAVLNDGPAECNPAYSVIARNIRFLEDSEEILALLKEIGFPEDMRSQFQRQLERGTLLIPRVSEFTAIFVCHRLRRFRLDLQMGLSDLLHPPKSGRAEDKGLVSRKSLGQNQQHQFHFKGDTLEAKNIILSTMPQLDGHAIDRYLGVASEHTFLGAEVVENETAEAIHKSYDELAQKLKAHALEHKANAVLGINYQLTPMPLESAMGSYRYKLTCTGNLVWVHKPAE